ncbi:hypothetical protein C8J57DRAFT_1529742 [Mycena rebaudengoi]|nr:hypothetical protein C8J57DRAFT_1529742 [Mycena rebaudengoi]
MADDALWPLELFTKSRTLTGVYYYLHLTEGKLASDGTTLVLPQTAPTTPHSSTPLIAPRVAANASTAPANFVPMAPALSTNGAIAPMGALPPYTPALSYATVMTRPHTSNHDQDRCEYAPQYPNHTRRDYDPRNERTDQRYDAPRHGTRTGHPHRNGARFSDNRGMSDPERRDSERRVAESYQDRVRSITVGSRHSKPTPPAAPSSIYPSTPPTGFTPVEGPLIEAVPQCTEGYPLFPIPTMANSGPHLTITADATRTQKWVREELKRITKAIAAPPPKRTQREPLAIVLADVGPWRDGEITSHAQAANVLDWSDAGNVEAYAKVRHVEQWFALRPKEPRSEGVQLILTLQKVTFQRFHIATMGCVPPPKPRQRAQCPPSIDIDTDPDDDVVPTPVADTPPVNMDAPLANADAPPADADALMLEPAPDVPSYLGASAPINNDTMHGPALPLAHAIAALVATETADWEFGVRNEHSSFPTKDTQYAVPLTADVRASRTIELLGPAQDGEDATMDTDTPWNTYFRKSIKLFSVSGLYGHIRYNFGTEHLDFSQVAAWFCTHGLTADSTDVLAIEDFACSTRNHLELSNDPTKTTFEDWPWDTSTTLNDYLHQEITPWNMLYHAPLRNGLESEYPIYPYAAFSGRSPTPAPDETGPGTPSPTDSALMDWSIDHNGLPNISTLFPS